LGWVRVMSETPQEIVSRLEREHHKLTLRHAQLADEAIRLAYEVLVQGASRWRLREVEDQGFRLEEEIALFDLALIEARRRASLPDWRAQFQQITGMEVHA
jgi:hypothetical protein